MSIFDHIGSAFASDFVSGPTVNPQYQQPQRRWVGLTHEEMQSIAFESADALSAVFVAEAKLRSKNNG